MQQLWLARQAEFLVFPLYKFVMEVTEGELPKVFRLFVYL